MNAGAAELMRLAKSRIAAGDLPGAQAHLEAAADYWSAHGNPAEQARCLRLAAALARHAGHPGTAVADAARAVAVAPPQARAAAHSEAARAALAAGAAQAAVEHCESALAAAPEGESQSALESDYAAALLAAGRGEDALAALRRAASAPGGGVSGRVLVDGVGQLQAAGRDDLAERLAAQADAAVASAGDHAAAAELALFAAARAVAAGDLPGARTHAQRARKEALAGRTATGYVTAAIALSELGQAAGDRVAAYESLAVGWVTLGDLAGPEQARATFEPQLRALRERWGAAEFAAVKEAYETKVRKA